MEENTAVYLSTEILFNETIKNLSDRNFKRTIEILYLAAEWYRGDDEVVFGHLPKTPVIAVVIRQSPIDTIRDLEDLKNHGIIDYDNILNEWYITESFLPLVSVRPEMDEDQP